MTSRGLLALALALAGCLLGVWLLSEVMQPSAGL